MALAISAWTGVLSAWGAIAIRAMGAGAAGAESACGGGAAAYWLASGGR